MAADLVRVEGPLRLWLFGQYLALRAGELAASGLQRREVDAITDRVLTQCFQSIVALGAEHPSIIERNLIWGALSASISDLRDQVVTAPARNLAFFLHGVYMVRTALVAESAPAVMH